MIVASGHEDQEVKELFASHDGLSFMKKPFKPEALIAEVRALMASGSDNEQAQA